MKKTKIEIKSWNRFITKNFTIEPSLLGRHHQFTFENYNVRIKLPDSSMLDRGKEYDEVITVTSRRTVDNEPIKYNILSVDLTLSLPVTVEIPIEVLSRRVNAIELLTDKEQKHLNDLTSQHEQIAERAFDYWVRVVRWKTDKSNFGRREIKEDRSKWGTYLHDVASEKKIWAGPIFFYAYLIKEITSDVWSEIQLTLERGLKPPIYFELKLDGEEYLKSGDFYRATIDFAVACETYLRFIVLNSLPNNLEPTVIKYVEGANIMQYINHFFPSCLDESRKNEYKKIKSNLLKLFDARNQVMHLGKMHRLTKETCLKFLEATNTLFSISPQANENNLLHSS